MGLTSRRDVRNIREREEPEEEEGLDPDRPHLPEASTTVGKGRIVLEFGYTFTGKDSTFSSHAYPEALLRIGMFADWLEFRVGQNFLSEAHTKPCCRQRRRSPVELTIGLTGIFPLTRKLDAFFPLGTTASVTGPRHYSVVGFVHFFTENFEMDIRVGIGLNGQAKDFLTGTGFAIRY